MAYEITGIIGRDLNARDEEREHVGGYRGESVGSFLSSLTSIIKAPLGVARSFIPGGGGGGGGGRHRHHRHHRFPGGQGGQGQGWQNQAQQQQGPWQQGPWSGNQQNPSYPPNTVPPINIS